MIMGPSQSLIVLFLLTALFSNNLASAAWWGGRRVIRFVPRRAPVVRAKKPLAPKPPMVAETKNLQASVVEAVVESPPPPSPPKKASFPGSLGVLLSAKSPPAQQLLTGSTDNVLGVFNFTETIGGEVEISELTFLDNIGSKGAMTSWIFQSFTNLTLWQGNKKVAGPIDFINNDSGSYKGTFTLTNPIVVGPYQTVTLILRGDVLPDTSLKFTDNSTHIFKILFGAYIAEAKPITALRTKLTVVSSLLGTAAKRPRSANDELVSIRFNADKGYGIKVNKMILTFKGNVLTEGQTLKVELNDFYTNANIAHSQCVIGANKSCALLFLLGIDISNNSNIVLKLKLNSELFANNPNSSDQLLITINEAIDVDWNNSVSLEEVAVPVTIAKINYE